MGGACSPHNGDAEVHTHLWSENLKGRDNLGAHGVDGRIIL